jgi:hypothetical protein
MQKYNFLIFILIFLTACSTTPCIPCYPCPNTTIEKEVIREVTVDKVCPECICQKCPQENKTIYNKTYIQGLIIEAKKCEKSQYFYNISECTWELNVTTQELERLKNTTIEDYSKLKKDYEWYKNKTEVYQDILCDYNGTYC